MKKILYLIIAFIFVCCTNEDTLDNEEYYSDDIEWVEFTNMDSLDYYLINMDVPVDSFFIIREKFFMAGSQEYCDSINEILFKRFHVKISNKIIIY